MNVIRPERGRITSFFKEHMENLKSHKGQTLIETAFVLLVLVLIALGTVEFARAWFTKNSMKNAARHGARISVVSEDIAPTLITITPPGDGTYVQCGNACPPSTPPPADNIYVINSVCCSPGVKNDSTTKVSLTYMDDDASGDLNEGDTILVYVKADFNFIIGGSSTWWPWGDQTLNANALMRYE